MTETDRSRAETFTLKVKGGDGPFRVRTVEEVISPDLKVVHLEMRSEQPAPPTSSNNVALLNSNINSVRGTQLTSDPLSGEIVPGAI